MKTRLVFYAFLCGLLFSSAGFAQTNAVKIALDDKSYRLLEKATEDSWFKKDAVVSTVFGGLMAILGGYGASRYAHKLELREKHREETEFKNNLLRTYRFDLEALDELFNYGIGAHIAALKEGHFLGVKLALTQDCFKVYNANASQLGKFEGEISRRIIVIYSLIQGMLEELNINNEYLS